MVFVPAQAGRIWWVEFVGFARKGLPIIVRHRPAVLFVVAAIRCFRMGSVGVLRGMRFTMGFVLFTRRLPPQQQLELDQVLAQVHHHPPHHLLRLPHRRLLAFLAVRTSLSQTESASVTLIWCNSTETVTLAREILQ